MLLHLPLVLVHTTSKSGVSVSFSPVELLQSGPVGPVGLQSQILWLLLLMLDPQAGEPIIGLRTLTPVGEPLQYNYSPVCGFPTLGIRNLIVS